MNVVNLDKNIKGMILITPSDTVVVDRRYNQALRINDAVGKTVKVTFVDDSVYTFGATELEDFDTIDAEIKLVWATGTTSGSIYGLRTKM